MANHVCEKSMNSSIVFLHLFCSAKGRDTKYITQFGIKSWKFVQFELWIKKRLNGHQLIKSQQNFREILCTIFVSWNWKKRTFFFVFDTMCHFSSHALLRIDKSQIKFGRKCIIKSCKLLYANDWINHSAKRNWILFF